VALNRPPSHLGLCHSHRLPKVLLCDCLLHVPATDGEYVTCGSKAGPQPSGALCRSDASCLLDSAANPDCRLYLLQTERSSHVALNQAPKRPGRHSVYDVHNAKYTTTYCLTYAANPDCRLCLSQMESTSHVALKQAPPATLDLCLRQILCLLTYAAFPDCRL
jgi:hypothetical protein